MPMLIPDDKTKEIFHTLENSTSNHGTYLELTGRNFIDFTNGVEHPIAPGYRLIRVDGRLGDDVFELAVLCDVNESIIYYNRVHLIHDMAFNHLRATQMLIWRTTKPKYDDILHKLPRAIFFNYLLNDYCVIVSDNQQTGSGMRFWQSRVADAFSLGHYVYHYEYLRGAVNLVQSDDEFDAMHNRIWGVESDYETQLVIISSKPLPVESTKI